MSKKAIIGAGLALSLLLPLAVQAEKGSGRDGSRVSVETENETETEHTSTDTTKIQELREQHRAAMEKIREANKEKLEGLKLQMCEKRQDVIDKNITKANEQAQKHLDVFTKIADRVIAFATDKDRKPENFDELVADINAKKADAQAAIDAAKTVDFDCNSDAPKGQIEAFRATLKTMRQALKAYRVSIKTLIVAVKATPEPTTSTEGATQ